MNEKLELIASVIIIGECILRIINFLIKYYKKNIKYVPLSLLSNELYRIIAQKFSPDWSTKNVELLNTINHIEYAPALYAKRSEYNKHRDSKYEKIEKDDYVYDEIFIENSDIKKTLKNIIAAISVNTSDKIGKELNKYIKDMVIEIKNQGKK